MTALKCAKFTQDSQEAKKPHAIQHGIFAFEGLMSKVARYINTNQLSYHFSVINELNLLFWGDLVASLASENRL